MGAPLCHERAISFAFFWPGYTALGGANPNLVSFGLQPFFSLEEQLTKARGKSFFGSALLSGVQGQHQ
jgi:hypothetical protein